MLLCVENNNYRSNDEKFQIPPISNFLVAM